MTMDIQTNRYGNMAKVLRYHKIQTLIQVAHVGDNQSTLHSPQLVDMA